MIFCIDGGLTVSFERFIFYFAAKSFHMDVLAVVLS